MTSPAIEVRRQRRSQAGPPLPVPAGVALVLTIAAGVLFASGPRPDSSAAATLDFLRDHQLRVQWVAFLVVGTAFPLAVLTGVVYRRLRRLGVSAPGSAIALVGGVLASGSMLLSGLVLWSAAEAGDVLDSGTARALCALSFAAGGIGFAGPLALLVAGVAVSGLMLGLMPRPLAWVGLAIAALGAVSTVGLVTSALYPVLPVVRFGGLLWLAVVGVVLPLSPAGRDRRPVGAQRAAAVPPPA